MIVIIDYGLGNPPSVRNMLRKAGHDAQVSADPAVVRAATKLILPGVGAFDHGMQNLADCGLIPVLNEAALERKVPFLGICLGMQLLSRGSEEGVKPGLGWLDATTVRFNFPHSDLRVPHMGWNTVARTRPSTLTATLPDESRFYFVHSFHLRVANPEDVMLTANYGGEVVAATGRGNIAGTQFHPEKSHKFGLALLRAFAEWDGRHA
jgi:glutamine amidotransferase